MDHLIVFNERHLRRVLSSYVDYYHHSRTHLSLDKDCPHPRDVQPPRRGEVIALRQVGGCTTATNASRPEQIDHGLRMVAHPLVRRDLSIIGNSIWSGVATSVRSFG